MIGSLITDPKTGAPLDHNGKKLSVSSYQPPEAVIKLFARCMYDYQVAWRLQHRTFDEFDGLSLLDRARLDQETFAAFVGAEFIPQHKRWRWRGRKNTARNKLIGILAHMLSAMLFPGVRAQNNENEEDKTTARVMRILVEEYLRKAGYKMKFLYMVLSALVNPAVFVEIDYQLAIQTVKQRMMDGTIGVTEAVDTILSGLRMNLIPIDQILLGDFYVNEIQEQPFIVKIKRISYDVARKIYAGKYFIDGVDQFNFVEAGKTRIVMAGQESSTLFDIQWTEGDQNMVQVLNFQYRGDDLEVEFVAGVFMGEVGTKPEDIYNMNSFRHRRMSLKGDEWMTIPVYNLAKTGFEPIDPSGRFAYYKSGAFKLYWDDATQNELHRMWIDATKLDTIKPILGTGIMKVDSTVIAPGAYITTPNAEASLTPWSANPNLQAAFQALTKQESDQSDSTQDPMMNGAVNPQATATAVVQAKNQAQVFLGTFGSMLADLITDVGELTMDCIIQHETYGELDATIPEALAIKERVIVVKGKDRGKDVTDRIIFTDAFMGKMYTKEQVNKKEWDLYNQAGGEYSDQRIHMVDPYRFARTVFTFAVDADDIIEHAMGNERQRKDIAFQKFTNPVVAPYVNMENVIEDFIIEEFSDGDPDRYKSKQSAQDIMGQIMGQQNTPSAPKQQPLPAGSVA